MLAVFVKFAVMWLVVEVTIRLLGRFMRESWRPWALVAVLTVAALGLAWV